MLRFFQLILFFFTTGILLYAQEGEGNIQLDRPGIRHFTKTDYKADNQNWCITQDQDGNMFIANNRGLLSFDGVRWNSVSLPGNTTLRSVAVDDSGRLYTGSFEEFGFWEKTADGLLEYTSLRPLLKNFTFHNEEIWKIIVWKGHIYFQSFSAIFDYDGKKVTPLRPPGFIDGFNRIGEDLLLTISDHGLYRLSGQAVVPVDTSRFFHQNLVRVLLPAGNGQLLVATADNGVFLYDRSGSLSPWHAGQAEYLRNTSINRGVCTSDGTVILGTILDGLFIFDRQGNLRFHVNKQNGLQNNTVLSLFTDQDGMLWAGLDNGVDLINRNSSVSFFFDPSGRLGSVYTLLLKNQVLYAGTNQGLFWSPFIPASGGSKLNFSFVENSQGQVWNLNAFGDQIICGHNDHTYELKNMQLSQLAPVSGGYAIREIHTPAGDFLLQTTYTDLAVYRKIQNQWTFSNTVNGFRNPSKNLEADHLGNIWVSHVQRGLYRIRLNEDLTEAQQVKFYGKRQGFLSDDHINVFTIQNRVVFTNKGHVFVYNDLSDTILRFDFVEDHLRPGSQVSSIFAAGDNRYWFVTADRLDLYAFSPGRMELSDSYPLDLFDGRIIQGNEFIYPADSSRFLVSLENGLALISPSASSQRMSHKRTLLRQVLSVGRRNILFTTFPAKPAAPVNLVFGQNSLEFMFSCPVYGSPIRFEAKLEGLEDQWIQVEQPIRRYDRLPYGSYTFRARAVDGRGNFSQEAIWPFVIKAPWYWNSWSKLLYLILLAVMIIMARAYLMRRLKNQESRLSREKEQELIRLTNEKLEAEVHYKSMQLANTTYSIIKKNELLLDLKKLLTKARRTSDPGWPRQLNEINRLLDQNLSNEDDWSIFESNFEQAHEEFLKRIKKQYPDLTPGDLKLCAFIRMNLPSKKIAPLLGISIRGVENHRYRLRLKMALDRDINLTDYLMNF